MGQNQQWELVQYEGKMPEAYDELLVPILFEPWAKKLIDFAKVGSGEGSVLNFGKRPDRFSKKASRAIIITLKTIISVKPTP